MEEQNKDSHRVGKRWKREEPRWPSSSLLEITWARAIPDRAIVEEKGHFELGFQIGGVRCRRIGPETMVKRFLLKAGFLSRLKNPVGRTTIRHGAVKREGIKQNSSRSMKKKKNAGTTRKGLSQEPDELCKIEVFQFK